MVRVDKAKAVERLQKLVDEASKLCPEEGHSVQFQKWLRDIEKSFCRIFGEGSRQYSELPRSYDIRPSGIRMHLDLMVSIVESTLDDVRYFWEDGGEEPSALRHGESPGIDTKSANCKSDNDGNRVFVIHGHDIGARESVARFLRELALQPVILHEQPNKGRTIIEKFEDYADVRFAVVLLTPDDVGARSEEPTELGHRARQNVIFELGFFLGKLGRKRVCALKTRGVETPSDYDGVVYVDFDVPGAWKLSLVRELKAAGLCIDTARMLPR